jgi:membrane protease YdiL (CAAX protease family)
MSPDREQLDAISPAQPLILAEPDTPFWGFGEIFAGAATFLVALELIGLLGSHLVGAAAKLGTWAVVEEFTAYLAMFAVLKALFHWHGYPLLRSLGWVRHTFTTTPLVACGLVLFCTGVVLQILLRMPDSAQTPFEKMLASDHFSLFAITAFGVTAGPVIEELLFRGLLQPVMIHVAGVLPGILITSTVFAIMHLPQNGGAWQSGVIIGIAGFGFGVIRHVTGSTRASSIAHIAYNALPFAVTLMQGAQPAHK